MDCKSQRGGDFVVLTRWGGMRFYLVSVNVLSSSDPSYLHLTHPHPAEPPRKRIAVNRVHWVHAALLCSFGLVMHSCLQSPIFPNLSIEPNIPIPLLNVTQNAWSIPGNISMPCLLFLLLYKAVNKACTTFKEYKTTQHDLVHFQLETISQRLNNNKIKRYIL